MSGSEIASVSSEFDIFVHRPIQTYVLGEVEAVYKPIAPVDQNDQEYLIASDSDFYLDIDIKLYVRSQFVSGAGKDVDLTDTTAVTNNLHSLFSQCNSTVNGTAVERAL